MSQNFKNQRLRLHGKPASKEDIRKKVVELLLGNPKRGIAPIGPTEIMRQLGFKSPQTVYNYRDEAIALGELQKDSVGKPILPAKLNTEFKIFNAKHPILTNAKVADWDLDLKIRNSGAGLVSRNFMIRWLEIMCNTLRIHPEQLLQEKKITETYGKNFIAMYLDGKAEMQYRTDPSTVDKKTLQYQVTKVLRDFLTFDGFTFRKGETGFWSQKVVNHGKYAHLRLTTEELEKADKFLQEKYGIDSDLYRMFWIGIETCARASALFIMTLDYTTHLSKKTGKTTYIMEVYESKTKHIKDGRWEKYIRKESTQLSIDSLKSRGGTRIYENKENYGIGKKFQLFIRRELKLIYEHLGKIPSISELDTLKKTKRMKKVGNYWYDRPIHVLRHVGAHYWLKKTKYNYGFVAAIGGWNTIDELKKSYGEMPAEVKLELLDEGEQFSL